MRHALPIIVAVMLLLWAFQPGAVRAQNIGAVEEVRSEAFATAPSAARARVAMARQVVSNEAIETARDAAVGLRFIDQTVFRIGPDSAVMLDRYVFDGGRGSGDMALNLSRGAFRFISGSMPKAGIAVRTPTALIGVRGTDFLVRVTATGATQVTVFEGSVTIEPLVGGAVLAVAPGQRGNVDDAGAAPRLEAAPPDESGAGFMGSDSLNRQIGSSGPRFNQSPMLSLPPPVFVPPPTTPVPAPPPQFKTLCFTGDTLVATSSGPRRIDAVLPGEWVLGLGEEGHAAWRRVRGVQRHGSEELRSKPAAAQLVALRIAGRDLRLTGDHPVLTDTGWRRAGLLQPGDWLRAEDGSLVPLQQIRHGLAPEAVFNLDVEMFPAYVAGGIFVSG